MITPSPLRRCSWFLSGGISQQAGMLAAPATIVFVLHMHAQRSYGENGLASLISLLLAWLLALPVGVLLDRARRGPALTVAALMSAVTLAPFAGAVWLDSLTAPHLLLAVVLLPVPWNAGGLGRDAYVPAVVGRARLVVDLLCRGGHGRPEWSGVG
ncbi:hypothetical protein ABGB18_05360 [Nonomuraea sp. B12E4]|uniref:hypothetical protein n=1 Tax=Nonomuraea sp. B12E4 TaxID=3153564 RepID=UPI00325C59AF